MYKQDLVLNNLHGLVCHKVQLTNQATNRFYDNEEYFCLGKWAYLVFSSFYSFAQSAGGVGL